MSIDYAAQFKLIDYTTADEMTAAWKRHRVYTDARKAFQSAQRTEARGIDVAFATTGFGQFHVWAEQREAVHVCFTDDTYCDECGVTDLHLPDGSCCEECGEPEDEQGLYFVATTSVYRDNDGLNILHGTYDSLDEAARVATYLNSGGAEVTQTPATLWIAEADSSHFSFVCTGFTEAEARATMARGLKSHADQYGLDEDWYPTDEINVHEVPLGGVLRDGTGINIV